RRSPVAPLGRRGTAAALNQPPLPVGRDLLVPLLSWSRAHVQQHRKKRSGGWSNPGDRSLALMRLVASPAVPPGVRPTSRTWPTPRVGGECLGRAPGAAHNAGSADPGWPTTRRVRWVVSPAAARA